MNPPADKQLKLAPRLTQAALDACPEGGSYVAGADGSPSRFAQFLIALLSREGSRETQDTATDARAVYRMRDGSYAAVFDNRAETANDESTMLRYADNSFAGVWAGAGIEDLERSIAAALERTNRLRQPRETPDHPASQFGEVVGADPDGDVVVAIDGQAFAVPSSEEKIMAALERARKASFAMAKDLGIPMEDLQAEMSQQEELFAEVAAVFRARRILRENQDAPKQ